MTTKEELLELLRLCNADPKAIDVIELAYELGFKAAQKGHMGEPHIVAEIENIIRRCSDVRAEQGLNKQAKEVALLVIQDCNKLIAAIKNGDFDGKDA